MGGFTKRYEFSQTDQIPNGLPPIGLAGGDLSGSYPNPTVSKILGNTIPVNANGYLLNDGLGNLSWNLITSGVSSFNTRTGAITLTSGDVTTALGYTPYNATNPSGYITSASLSLYLLISSFTDTAVTGKLLTGYTSGAGTVASTDSILQAIQKLNGNITGLTTGVSSVSGTTNRITSSPTTGAVIVDISASYIGQSSITTLGTIGTGIWQGTVVGATYGGTGVNNGAKTITLGASLTTTGAGAPTLAFSGTGRTYTFPDVATTVVGQTGTSAANYVAYWNDANQITGTSVFQYKNFDVGNNGNAIYLGNTSTNNFVLGCYNLSGNTVILNCPTSAATSAINMRFQNGGNVFNITSDNSGINGYVGTKNFFIGGTTVPTAHAHIAAGLAAAGGAPIKIVSGINLTVAEAGVFAEYDGTNFFGTPNTTIGRWPFAFNSVQYSAPTTGTTVTSTAQTAQLVCNPAGTLVALTITFPSSPVNGQTFGIAISQIITTLTLNGAGTDTIDGTITTSSINSNGGWVYVSAAVNGGANGIWFKTH